VTEDEWERLAKTVKKMEFNAVLPLVGSRYIRFYDPDLAAPVQESGKVAMHKIQTNDHVLSITDIEVSDPEDLFPIVFHRGNPKSLT